MLVEFSQISLESWLKIAACLVLWFAFVCLVAELFGRK